MGYFSVFNEVFNHIDIIEPLPFNISQSYILNSISGCLVPCTDLMKRTTKFFKDSNNVGVSTNICEVISPESENGGSERAENKLSCSDYLLVLQQTPHIAIFVL